MNRPSLARFAWLSIAAAVLTIGLKMAAYWLTGSVGLLSDALESVVNLVAAVLALTLLHVAARPPDDDHAYGHTKAEYFASAVEGMLILFAAGSIAWAAWGRLFDPQPIESPGIGLGVSVVASAINLAVSRVLASAGKRYHSITLEADAHHLMTDVWTSVGVVVAIALVAVTGWNVLDPVIALVVAANIVWTGVQLVRRSTSGLMDEALPPGERQKVEEILASYADQGVAYHALLTRQAAAQRFVSVHVLVPDFWTVQHGHAVIEQIERNIRHALPNTNVLTHLEPRDDPSSLADIDLYRDEEVLK